MKKPLKITIFILLTISLLVNIWLALWFKTKKPFYENFHGMTFRTAHADDTLTSEEAIKDVDYYISEIKTYHPQLFLFMIEDEDRDLELEFVVSKLL